MMTPSSKEEDPRLALLQDQVERLRGMLREAIEERASAQRDLDACQRRYLELTDRVPWAVLRVRADGTYADVNPYFAEVLGRAPADIVDQPVGSLGEPAAWISAILDGTDLQQSEVTLEAEGKMRRYLLLKFRDRQRGHLSLLALDQTERALALDEAKRQAERADAANLAKSRFLAVMSHEIRTPMNGVLGMAQLLEGTSLDDEQRSYLETILSSGAALSSLINAVLDLTKIEAGGLELERTPFSPGRLTEEIAALFRAQAFQKKLRLDVDLSRLLPRQVLGDGLRVRQVLTNLVSNALKFTSEGGVDIRLAGDPREGGWDLVWRVEDSGIGLATEQVERIFEAFAQADASTTRRYGGTGLGLNISKGLVEAMEGQISVASEPGRGTTFVVSLPFEEAPFEPSEPRGKLGEVDLSGLRVLLAEDNHVNQLVTSRMLSRLGCQVTCAENGELAVTALDMEGPFDAVLMDMDMPVMDGVEATRVIRSGIGGHPDVPIIALTANALLADRETCLEMGMTAFLTKPVTFETLAQHLWRHAGGPLKPSAG
ncbi:MAG: ATP-binding protein [Myxococcota bacterium]